MAEDFAAKTEEPTPKRREEARAEGNIPRSVEITSAAVLLGALLVAWQQGDTALAAVRTMLRASLLSLSAVDLTPGQLFDMAWELAWVSFRVLAPIFAVTATAALVAGIAQVGIGIRPKRIKPKTSAISPASGLQRIFSRRGLVELAKSLAKIALVGTISWVIVRGALVRIVALPTSPPAEILAVTGSGILRIMGWALIALAGLAALDYAFQRWQHHQQLRMTRTEVKDERRQAEGDPQIRGRVKRAYQQLAKARTLTEVPTADVVVTNPVHLAVALRYLPGAMGAPTVVAKGAEHMAERIKAIARRHGIPIVERRALARALFRTVRIGGEIPSTLYRAVAEILAYIYALQARRAG